MNRASDPEETEQRTLNFSKPTLLATFISAAITSTAIHAATSLDMVVAIDESGSMSGEHNAFIGTYVKNLDSLLNDQNVTLNQFGLLGFGGDTGQTVSANEAGRENGSALYRHLSLDSDASPLWGNAADFDAVTHQLQTSGGTEDGYRAIDYLYRHFQFRPTAGSSIMLITDEDRDNDFYNLDPSNLPTGMTEIDKSYIQSQLAQYKTVVHAVVSQRFTDKSGNTAIAVVGSDPDTGYAYVKDGNGVISKVQGYVLSSADGTTESDYTELALRSGGTAMDIDGLRSVYTDATALAALSGELAKLVADIAVGQVPVVGIDCGAANGVAAQICSAIAGSGNSQLQAIGQELDSPEQYSQLTQYQVNQMLHTAVSNTRNVRRVVLDRLADLRRNGFATSDIDVMDYNNGNVALSSDITDRLEYARGGAASAEQGEVGYFIRGIYTKGEYDSSAAAPGFDSKTYTFVAGIDRYLSDATQVGAALSYSTSDSDYSDVGGDSETDTYGIAAYGSHELGQGFYLEGNVGFSRAHFDTNRDTGFGMVEGNTKGDIWNLSAGVTKAYPMSSLTLEPFAYLHYTDVSVDGFTEKGGAAALRVSHSSFDSLISELGFTSAYQLTESLTGDLRLAWEHEFKDTETTVPVSFVSAPGNVFVSQGESQSTDYGRIGLGLTKAMAYNRSLSLRAETLVGHDNYDEYSIEARFRQSF
ncbi:MAG TPA: autotransporter outer membrane beta-barrel domain-containing protein [Pseudomonas sabulinigri]|uniref:Autotransporter domain-containing protein n=1 Tax=marine sediment metagenome TaxID=412755 RepID=A0A0F9Y8E8_9ZZZZ|nr:autotransporter outer membrane beta-barrel domain-containing protein [Halopseudomonas sabulinigri]HEC51762.1 autotransporter outer membrane beta-barrel domain-containing protein [Halopseudomonas sabulinigri]